MRRWHGAVLLAFLTCLTASCGAFGESAERLSTTPALTTSSPVASPTAMATSVDGLPLIVVESPPVDAEVASPLVVRGTADVYEAVVHVRLTAQDGSLISGVDTKATCGTGCRGEFRIKVHFFVGQPQQATLEVFGSDGPDGSPVGIVEVPLTLFP
ncbi:MAG TPA: Gmad2 immunoglobulin-like domain-containing protein [Actinomycetota bacterium]|jgi:hypothetical protein|nr:Gmad2 immunoglobulin-like domain-containing protein [Actinomycetota bacterium]